MQARHPYNWPDVNKYPPAYVWLGWDGIYRTIHKDGTVVEDDPRSGE